MFALLLRRHGYEVDEVPNGEEAIKKLDHGLYDLLITDILMGRVGGMEVLRVAKQAIPDVEVIIITGHGTVESAVEAMRLGAFDYLTKPVEREKLLVTVSRALERKGLRKEIQHLRARVSERYGGDHVIGVSPKMEHVFELVDRVAMTDATVLILGESGTGKDVIANKIHHQSRRVEGAFIAVNCGALPESLLESELFGHVKGAYTGAISNKKGLFEEASGGTLFLDEISEITPAVQVKLLRALQDGEIRRVGDNRSIRVDTRVIAATNNDLKTLVQEGAFRSDLFYRLNVFPIFLPPLRERREDILPLAEYFLHKVNTRLRTKVYRLSSAAIEVLMGYLWPGNVRELENVIERAIILSTDDWIDTDDLPPEISGVSWKSVSRPDGTTLAEMERQFLLETLERCGGDRVKTAKQLGIARSTLWRKLKRYGIPEE
jgi:DNA-binding NtrC family response regulator